MKFFIDELVCEIAVIVCTLTAIIIFSTMLEEIGLVAGMVIGVSLGVYIMMIHSVGETLTEHHREREKERY